MLNVSEHYASVLDFLSLSRGNLFALVGEKLAGREVLGWGDVKFITATGMLLGLPGALFTLFAGSFSGSVGGTVCAVRRRRSLQCN